ncbi:MAG: hypothetical protein Q8R53_01935, partial [Nanoarchaeota archaeon]|nr:hypothetical protein [Nanoarchaeota archaeon]
MDKKGQWAHAMARERRSQERNERVLQTYIFKKSKKTVESIARELGVSSNTIVGYLREIRDSP